MGKKKKAYVRPEMKIIEVKTEGVIASSGVIDFPDIDFTNGCKNNWFDNSCGSPEPKIQNCEVFKKNELTEGEEYNTCFKEISIYNPHNWNHVTLKKENGKIYIYKGWTTERKK